MVDREPHAIPASGHDTFDLCALSSRQGLLRICREGMRAAWSLPVPTNGIRAMLGVWHTAHTSRLDPEDQARAMMHMLALERN